MKFVLVGDGFPVIQIIEMLKCFDQVSINMLFTNPNENGKSKAEQVAEQAGIPVYESKFMTTESGIELLRQEKFNYLININSTVIFPIEVLQMPKHGAINMHPGLLPEYAGLHTHQWAIRNGEEEFGATIHFIEEKLDTGNIISQVVIPITNTDTGMSLFLKCIKAGTEGMRIVIQTILDGEPLPEIQQDLSKYHLYRHKDALNGEIDWTKTATNIERFIRAGSYSPFESPTYKPYFRSGNSKYEVLKAEVFHGDDVIGIGQIQWKAGCLIVGCGKNTSIELVKLLYVVSGKKISQDEMKKLFQDGLTLGVKK